MKNVLVILNESGGPGVSENRLYQELSQDSATRLLDFMMDHAVSELFPVEAGYDLCLCSSSDAADTSLQDRLGDSFRYLKSDAKHGELVTFLSDALPEYDRIAILRSCSYGWEEEAICAIFARLDVFDGVTAASHQGDLILLAVRREDMDGLSGLTRLTREAIDAHADNSGLHYFSMPDLAVADDLAGLSRLREALRPESGMARQIDAAVLDATAYDDDAQ